MKLAILLATYNGGKYLREQLDSIIIQTHQNFQLYIRDDGSIDNTLAIIDEYIKLHPHRICLLRDDITHRGAANSFMWLLENVDSDYYMFCDQDDIWIPNKIELTLKKILLVERDNPRVPILIHTDLKVVDENLRTISPSFWGAMKLKPNILQHINYIAVCNCVTGCTMMINKVTREYSLSMPNDAPMHDHWIAYVCAYNGVIDNLPNQTILYRQHGNNTVGAKTVSLGNTIKKIIRIHKHIQRYYRSAAFFKDYGYGSIPKWFLYKILYLIRR